MTRTGIHAACLVLLALLCLAPRAARAAEDYDNCIGFITSVPIVVSTPGTWCLKQDLTTAITSGSAITLQGNNITIDCNGFKLGGLAAGAGTNAYGIFADSRYLATVRNCNIRGFLIGIFLYDTPGGGHLVEDNRLDGNTGYGIEVTGDGSTVRRNLITDTGGSTVFAQAEAIVASGSVDILDNTIAGVTASGYTRGIDTGNNYASINGNQVRGLVGTAQTAILVATSHATLRDNNLLGTATAGSAGISCNDTNTVMKNNAINGFETASSNCRDGGGNDAF
jgi:hypothetical protein